MPKARQYHHSMVHFVRKGVLYSQLTSGTAVVIGTLPPGAVVCNVYAVVKTAFNSATSDLLDMGTSGSNNAFMSAVSIASVGQKLADDMATSSALVIGSTETDVVAKWTGTGAAPSAGEVEFVVEFLPDNDG